MRLHACYFGTTGKVLQKAISKRHVLSSLHLHRRPSFPLSDYLAAHPIHSSFSCKKQHTLRTATSVTSPFYCTRLRRQLKTISTLHPTPRARCQATTKFSDEQRRGDGWNPLAATELRPQCRLQKRSWGTRTGTRKKEKKGRHAYELALLAMGRRSEVVFIIIRIVLVRTHSLTPTPQVDHGFLRATR